MPPLGRRPPSRLPNRRCMVTAFGREATGMPKSRSTPASGVQIFGLKPSGRPVALFQDAMCIACDSEYLWKSRRFEKVFFTVFKRTLRIKMLAALDPFSHRVTLPIMRTAANVANAQNTHNRFISSPFALATLQVTCLLRKILQKPGDVPDDRLFLFFGQFER